MSNELSCLVARRMNARAALQRWLVHVLLGTSVAVALNTSVARAQATPERSPASSAQDVQQQRWYGLPIVVTDVAAVLLMGAAATAPDHALGLLGASAGIYALGGPVIHLYEEQPKTAGASFGLRLLPLAVGAPLMLTNLDSREPVAVAAGASIMVLGGLAAVVVDIVALAWKPLDEAQTSFLVAGKRTADGSFLWTVTTSW